MVDIEEFIKILKQNMNDITESDLQRVVRTHYKATGKDEEKLLQRIANELKRKSAKFERI